MILLYNGTCDNTDVIVCMVQMTVDKIYNVLQFVDGGWLVDMRSTPTVSI